MGELKPGWNRVKFGEVVHLNTDKCKDPQKDGLERYVGLEHIESDDLRVRSWGNVADGTTFTNRFAPGQVLFGKRRAYQRKVAVADFEGVCSGDIYVLEPKDDSVLIPELLPFICQTEGFFQHAVGTSAGSLSPRTNWKSLSGYEFGLPTPQEQTRMVGLFAMSEEAADAAGQLAAACQTAMESAVAQHFAPHGAPPPGEHPMVPSSWSLVPAEELCSAVVTKGATPRSELSEVDSGTPFIKVYNLGFDGRLDFSVSPTFISEEGHARLARSGVREGDVLMNIVGPPLGKLAMVPTGFPESNINQAIVRYRCTSREYARLLLHYLRSVHAKAWLLRRSKKTSGQRNLTLALCRELPVPVPPPSVRNRMLEQLDELRAAEQLASARASRARRLHAGVVSAVLKR